MMETYRAESPVKMMSHSKPAAVRNTSDKCLCIDMYGHSVGMIYDGNDTFRTMHGSICTIMVTVAMLVCMGLKLTQISDPIHALPVTSQVSDRTFFEMFREVGAI